MEALVYSLLTGLILSTVLSAVVLATLFINPEIWIDDYPPDVRARFGPIGTRARRQRRWAALLFFLVPLVMLAGSLPGLESATGASPGFWQLFFHVFISLEVFNVIDLVILDWLVFIRIQPPRIILPGTHGMAGYQDFRFHVRGFMFGQIIILVFSLLFAGFATRFV